jgi:TPR repeat protein
MKKLSYLLVICCILSVANVYAVEEDAEVEDLQQPPVQSNYVPNYSPVFTTDIYDLGEDAYTLSNDDAIVGAFYKKKLSAVTTYRLARLKEELNVFLGINNDRERVKIIGRVSTAFGTAAAAYGSGFLLAGFTVEAGWRLTDAFADIVCGEGIDPIRIDMLKEKIEAWVNGIETEAIAPVERDYIIAKYRGQVSDNLQTIIERVLIEARDQKNLKFDAVKFVADMLRMPQRATWLPPESSFDAHSFHPTLQELFKQTLNGDSILADYPAARKNDFKAILQGISNCTRNDYNFVNRHNLVLSTRYAFYGDLGIGTKKAPEAIAEALGLTCHYFRPDSLHSDDIYGTDRYGANPKRGELAKAFFDHEKTHKNTILVIDLDEIYALDNDCMSFINILLGKQSFHSDFYNCDIDLSNMHIIFTVNQYAQDHVDSYYDNILAKGVELIEFTDLPVDTKRRLLRNYIDTNDVLNNGLGQHVGARGAIIDLIMRYKSHLSLAKLTQITDKLSNTTRDQWDDILGVYRPSQNSVVAMGLSHVDGLVFKNGRIYRHKLDGSIKDYSADNHVAFNLSLDRAGTLDSQIIAVNSEFDLENKRFIPRKIELLESPYVYYKHENDIHKFYLVRMHRVSGFLGPDVAGGGEPHEWESVQFDFAEKTRHRLATPYDMRAMEPMADGMYYVNVAGDDIELVGLDKSFKTRDRVAVPNGAKLFDNLTVDGVVTVFEALHDQLLSTHLRVLDFRKFALGAKEIAFLKRHLENPRQKHLRAVCLNGDGMSCLLKLIAKLPELRKLIMTNGDISAYSYDLESIAQHPKLVHLDLRGNSDLNSGCFAKLLPLLNAHNDGSKPLEFFSLLGMTSNYDRYSEEYEDGKLKSVTLNGYDMDPVTITLAKLVEYDHEIITKAAAFTNMGQYYQVSSHKDYKKAREYYEIAIDKGHYLAKFHLAGMLKSTDGGLKDLARAKKLYLESTVGTNYREGQYEYGMMFLESDPKGARRWIELSAEQNYNTAIRQLASMYLEGVGGDKDTIKAKKWNRKYVVNESYWGPSNFEYAHKCHKGTDWDKDLVDARLFYKKAADKDHVEAAFEYAKMCRDGIGGDQDCADALEYFKKAADKDHVEAAFAYAMMDPADARVYLKKAADKEHKEAQYKVALVCEEPEKRQYLKKSANQGHKDAQYSYAVMCNAGKGGDKDEAEARKYFGKAAANGIEAAYDEYASMCYSGKGDSIDYIQARKYFKILVEKGKPYRENQYAWLCYEGKGGARDYKEALKYYKKMADRGIADAQFRYGKMCYYGYGREYDTTEAAKYIEMAFKQGNADAKAWKNAECVLL